MVRTVLAMAALACCVQPLCAQGPCCCMSRMGGAGGSPSANSGLYQLAASQQLAAMLQQAQLAAFVQRVSQEDEETLRKRCRSQNPVERFAAAVAIGQKDLPLKPELTALRSDPNPVVRQAAAQSLLLMSKRSRQPAQTQRLQTEK